MENFCSSKSDKIILNKDSKTISDEKELCKTFSAYFANINSDPKIPNIHKEMSDITCNDKLVLAVINTFQNHPSVVNVKQKEFKTIFSFNNTNENEVPKIIKKLNICKTCQR